MGLNEWMRGWMNGRIEGEWERLKMENTSRETR